jgi:hypothetical protein
MPASRSIVTVLLRELLGDFSLHPQGRPCGRPPAAAVLAPADSMAGLGMLSFPRRLSSSMRERCGRREFHASKRSTNR